MTLCCMLCKGKPLEASPQTALWDTCVIAVLQRGKPRLSEGLPQGQLARSSRR